MKKKDFVTLIMSTVGGILFAWECAWRCCRSGAL